MKELGTFRVDSIICPHCGFEIEEWWTILTNDDLFGGGTVELACEDCKKEFDLEVDVTYKFTTEKPDDYEEKDDEED